MDTVKGLIKKYFYCILKPNLVKILLLPKIMSQLKYLKNLSKEELKENQDTEAALFDTASAVISRKIRM